MSFTGIIILFLFLVFFLYGSYLSLFKLITTVSPIFKFLKLRTIDLTTKIKPKIIKVISAVSTIIVIVIYYIGLCDSAINRYESSLEKQEQKAKDLSQQLNNNNLKDGIQDLILLQQALIHQAPDIKNPISILRYFFYSPDQLNFKTIQTTQTIIAKNKAHLSDLNLNDINLTDLTYDESKDMFRGSRIPKDSDLDFSKAIFIGSSMKNAKAHFTNFAYSNFSYAILSHSDFTQSNLLYANLNHATLVKTILQNVILTGADLRKADLYKADLRGALLIGANLEEATGLNYANLEGAKYNSTDIKPHPLLSHDYQVRITCKERYPNKSNLDKCIDKITSYTTSLYNRAVERTKFPIGFNPKEYAMIDISEDTSKNPN